VINDESGNENAAAGERVGFCQDCGKPLTQETIRTVGSGVFCEPCLEMRVSATGQNPAGQAYTAAQGAGSGYGTVSPPIGTTGDQSPLLAGFLGLIPGVGAMYNGQFAKGIVHLIIFAVLVSLSDHVSGVFGLFVFGWVCYQAFEAYHTAKARLEGLPLPNAFGFNDIGDRMGFGKNWPGSASRPPMNPPVTQWKPGPATAPPVRPATDWVGYVPPTTFAAAPPVPPYSPTPEEAAERIAAATRAQAIHDAGYASVPYVETHTGVPPTAEYQAAAPVAPPPTKRFPVGAIWLIGLGVLFLLANLDTSLRVSERWLVPVLLAGVAIWSFTRRLKWMTGTGRLAGDDASIGAKISCLRWPVLLMVLAILFTLQAAGSMTLGQTWPMLVIALGALLLVERSAAHTDAGAVPYAPPAAGPGGWPKGGQ
jgi:TM2 domain-containing membrane protein YozV